MEYGDNIGTFLEYNAIIAEIPQVWCKTLHRGSTCHAMKTKGMVFRYTWVYSKEDTMAHTCRLVVTS